MSLRGAMRVVLSGFVERLDDSRSETTVDESSTVVREFLDAAHAYAAQRHVPLNAAIAGAGEQPVLVTRSALVGSGYLAPSFPTTTSFGATLSAYVRRNPSRSEEHTSELQSLMRISYDVFCLKTQK